MRVWISITSILRKIRENARNMALSKIGGYEEAPNKEIQYGKLVLKSRTQSIGWIAERTHLKTEWMSRRLGERIFQWPSKVGKKSKHEKSENMERIEEKLQQLLKKSPSNRKTKWRGKVLENIYKKDLLVANATLGCHAGMGHWQRDRLSPCGVGEYVENAAANLSLL